MTSGVFFWNLSKENGITSDHYCQRTVLPIRNMTDKVISLHRGNSPRLPICLIPNNIHEKISPFSLVKSSAVVFCWKQCRKELIRCKEVTNQAFWLVNDQRNSQMANQIFCFQIKGAPWMAQFMAQFFPDCVIRVRFFCLTISNFFHLYYW